MWRRSLLTSEAEPRRPAEEAQASNFDLLLLAWHRRAPLIVQMHILKLLGGAQRADSSVDTPVGVQTDTTVQMFNTICGNVRNYPSRL